MDYGDKYKSNCAFAVAKEVGVSVNDVVAKDVMIAEGNGDRTVNVGVPNATADWICITDYQGSVKQVYFGGSEGYL
jgi:hypothetical protein